MNYCALSATEELARALLRGMACELYLTPKPGLVDLCDNGSHDDLSLPKMVASIDLLDLYFRELLAALAREAPLPELIAVGRRAEERMFATLGTNTHKGAIFLGGLLLVARARSDGGDPPRLSPAVAAVAREVLALSSPGGSNGHAARQAYRVGGVLGEALAGLPALFEVAIPAYLGALAGGAAAQTAAFLMMSRLMQTIDDTTALHRCGMEGLERLRRDGRTLEQLLARGDDPVPLLCALNVEYRAMNLTMGGVADLLGLSFGYLAHLGHPLPDARTPRVSEFELGTVAGASPAALLFP